MDNKQNESGKLKTTKSFLKSQEILKKTINSINLEREKYTKVSNNDILVQQAVFLPQQKSISFYKKYKSLKYTHQKNLLKYKTRNPNLDNQKYDLFINKIFIYKLTTSYIFKRKFNNFKSRYRQFTKYLLSLKPSLNKLLLKNILFTEKYSLYYLIKIKRNLEKILVSDSKQFKDLKLVNKFVKVFANFQFKAINAAEKFIAFIKFFDKKKLLTYLNRFVFILKIYFLPFIFLANQSLIPFIQEYEELVVNSFSSVIFQKIPFLITLIKLFNPIINSFNKMFQFWVLIAYFLIFPLGYRSLKLSYKLGYNGSIALIFLLINSSLSFSQEIIIAIFESLKMTKDILFTSYLVKHIGKSKNKEREEALRIFNNLVQRYEIQIRQDYFNWLLFLNHYILSPLAFISIAVLVYNCLYYIIYNKNPKIPLVTKAALATIKNPQEEE